MAIGVIPLFCFQEVLFFNPWVLMDAIMEAATKVIIEAIGEDHQAADTQTDGKEVDGHGVGVGEQSH